MMGNRLLSLATAAVLAAVGAATPALGQAEPTAYEQLNLFGDAYDRVRRAYVEEIADDVVIRAAINGLLAALDPNSMLLSADQYNAMTTSKRDFDGLGIEITMSQGVAQVIAPLDDSPAAAAGLRPGDLIVDVNRTPIYGMTLPEAVAALRGDPGTSLDLLIVREGEDAFITTAELAAVAAPTVRSRLRGREGYLRIPFFDDGTAAAVTAAVESLVADAGGNLGGLVIDLRNTPGGSIDAGVAVADLFLQSGEIASVRGRNDQITEVFTAGAGEILAGLPIVLLADRGTAGAAEILTGALKDHARAIVVGTPTFGMGSRQTVVPMGGAGFVQLTTGYFFTPSGASIHGEGVAPEVEVVPSRVVVQESRFPRRTEATLRGALDVPDENAADVAELSIEDDYQLARALDLLHAMSLADQAAD